MEKLDVDAIKELSEMMAERGVPYQTGRMISVIALPNTQQMVMWMKANPNADIKAMREKAKELGENS